MKKNKKDLIEINLGYPDVPGSFILEIISGTILFLRRNKKIGKEKISLSVAGVGLNRVRKLNSQYRGLDEPTDVLSFCYDKNQAEISGEIILCLDYIVRYCQKEKLDFKQEVKKNIIHGMLHIIGYDHSIEMFQLQEAILKNFE